MRKLVGSILACGAILAFSLNPLHAQTSGGVNFNGNLALVQTPVQDDILMITADAAGLNRIDDVAVLPRSGTFLVIMPGYGGITALPYPCMTPALAGLPVYGVTGNTFIVDDTFGQVFANPRRPGRMTANMTAGAALELQANAVMNLINNLQGAQLRQMAQSMGLDVPGFDDIGNGGTNNSSPYSNDYSSLTNGLWLQINNYDGNFAYANLNNATDQVYAVWTATDISSGWQVAAELWPTPAQTNVLPFTIPTSGQPILFVRAEDWTGVTENGNTTPDWWFWYYYGTTARSDTNQDANGNSLLSDYTNNVVPPTFTFSGVEAANNYVSATPATVQLNVTGSPYYVAVLVDDTNFNDAVWNNYTSSYVSVPLWPQGWHEIWIGLRGHADAPTNAIWQWRRLKLDYTPPSLAITGPMVAGGGAATVDMPVIQLTGYSPEALSVISYDLSNAAGMVTNQLAVITRQTYNTSTMEFSTNYFQCYDVSLTNGVNNFTFHLTDLAGNVSTLATSVTLDYSAKTNPPVVALLWPLDGMEICGSNIVCRGQVSDQSVSVTVQLVDANGATNSAGSLVGRDGIFYADSLTLAPGTNYLSYTVTDTRTNTSSTNITVVTSDMGMTLAPVAAGQSVVTGTIDDTNYTVYVNGVQASMTNGSWTAQIAPIGIGGGAVVVNAIQDGPSLQQIVQPPQGVFVSSYHSQTQVQVHNWLWYFDGGIITYDNLDWQDGLGGSDTTLYQDCLWIQKGSPPYLSGVYPTLSVINWPTNNWPQSLPWGVENVFFWTWKDDTNFPNFNYPYLPSSTNTSSCSPLGLAQEHCDTDGIIDPYGSTQRRTADTEMKLATGGPPGSTQKNLWVISASAIGYTNLDDTQGYPIPYDQISIGSFGHLDTNGNLYVILPDNDPDDFTPMIAGVTFFKWLNSTAKKYPLTITANGIALSNDVVVSGADFCVGQNIKFDVIGLPNSLDGLLWGDNGYHHDDSARWKLPGTFVNTNSDPNCDLFYDKTPNLLTRHFATDGNISTHCWYVLDTNQATVSVTLYYRFKPNGSISETSVTGKFNVHRPSTAQATPYQPDGAPTAVITNITYDIWWNYTINKTLPSLSLGDGNRHNDMSFSNTITADNFSAGQAGYVQLITSGDIISYLYLKTFDAIGLDGRYGEFARGTPSVPANATAGVSFWDGPCVPLASNNNNTSEDLFFSTYLMFKPDLKPGDPGPNIFVPLRLITWELHDEATHNADGTWTPHNYSDQMGTRQTTTGTPVENESTTFPRWTTTY